MQPVMPAIDLQDDEDHLQDHVRVQLHLIKNIDVQRDLDEAGRPAPDVLPDAEPDAKQAEEHGESFDAGHVFVLLFTVFKG